MRATNTHNATPTNKPKLSLLGGRSATQRIEHAYHAFWGAIEWMCNTLLFVWQGIVLMMLMVPRADAGMLVALRNELKAADVGYLVLLYVWILVRAVCCAVCCCGCWGQRAPPSPNTHKKNH
jgi:hypothetical protein